MQLDIMKIAQDLVVQLWAESDKMKERAEGVKLLLHTLIKESEKLHGQAAGESKDSQPGLSEETEKQAE